MQAQIEQNKYGIAPKSLTFQVAAGYSGLSVGTLRNYEAAGLIKVYNLIQPGSSRGRKLIDRKSLDDFLEGNVGTVTTANICGKGGKA